MKPGRHFAGRQSPGARPYQEDSWGEDDRSTGEDGSPDDLVVVLADGMGGHQGGAHASRVAVETFIATYRDGADGTVPERLRRALEESNRRIAEDSEADPGLEGMGCTLVGLGFVEGGMYRVSVGDSPLWLFRNGRLERLNEDHSMAPLLRQQVEDGEMSGEEAANHPHRNALRSAVVGTPIELVDNPDQPLALQPGDRIVLASDGAETLTVEELAGIAAFDPNADSGTVAERMVTAVDAREAPAQDNTTVVVVSPWLGGDAASENRTLVHRGGDSRAKAGDREKKGKSGWLLLVLVLAVVVLWALNVMTGPTGESPAEQAAPVAPAAPVGDAPPADETGGPVDEAPPADETGGPVDEAPPADETGGPVDEAPPADDAGRPASEAPPAAREAPETARGASPAPEAPAAAGAGSAVADEDAMVGDDDKEVGRSPQETAAPAADGAAPAPESD